MDDRNRWDDRDERERWRAEEGSRRPYAEDRSYRGEGGHRGGWRSEDQDWRSQDRLRSQERYRGGSGYEDERGYQRGGYERDRGGSDYGYESRVGGYGGSAGGYGYSMQGRESSGMTSQSYAGDADQGHRHYRSSGYGYSSGQQGGTPPQPWFTGQQQGWEVPSSRGAPGSFGASYGGGTGGYGGGFGGSQGYGDDYREHGYGSGRNERGFLQKAGDEIASWFGDEDAARRREQDHRGRGPSDYTRSDERIREDVNDRLTDDWRLDASSISVTVESGEVTLHGTVSDRRDKRRAEDIAEDISGVKHVQNNLRVQQSSAWDDTERTSSTGSASATGTSASARGSMSGTGTTGTTGTTGSAATATGASRKSSSSTSASS